MKQVKSGLLINETNKREKETIDLRPNGDVAVKVGFLSSCQKSEKSRS